MLNAEKVLSPIEIESIDKMIQSIESQSDGEVVVSIATESGRYDRAESLWGLVFALLFLPLSRHIEQFLAPYVWDVNSITITSTSLVFALSFLLGSLLSTYFKNLRSLFVSDKEIEEEVINSALRIYGKHRLVNPDIKTMVLVYISLCERKVQILSDSFFVKNIGQTELETIKNSLVENLRKGSAYDGIINVLKKLQNDLNKHCPLTDSNKDIILTNIELHHPRV